MQKYAPFDKLIVGFACDTGKKRKDRENQDAVGVFLPNFFFRQPPLLIVADGMGGYAGGELASRLVVNGFNKIHRRTKNFDSPEAILNDSVGFAHELIKRRAQKKPELHSMGSTVVVATIFDEKLSVLNVGDSRAYIIANDQMIQLSVDQSWVGEQMSQDLLTPEQARKHKQKNRLTMSISAKREEIEPNFYQTDLAVEDIVVLCSDGLWGMVPDLLIKSVVMQLHPQEAADKLVELANANGGVDNISVIVARFAESVYSEDDIDLLEKLDETNPGF